MSKPEPAEYAAARAGLIEQGFKPEQADDIIDLLINPDRIEEFRASFAHFMEHRFSDLTKKIE